MRAQLGEYVTLHFDDGTEVSARPFILTRTGNEAQCVDLYTDEGVRIRCIDEKLGHYVHGESGRVLTLSRR